MNTKMLVSVALALLFAVAPLQGQVSLQVQGSGAQFSRSDLTELLARYEEAALSPAYSSAVREAALQSAERIRRRLDEGDFRLGDRILLTVRNEPNLPDTVPVQTGPLITLQPFGEVDLTGVLRSELEDHLTTALGRYINEPVVNATALTRLSVTGAVLRPGFYYISADRLLSDAVDLAGIAPTGEIGRLRVERANQPFLQEDEVQAALSEGLTIDQLSLQAGDQLVMPADDGRSWLDILQVVGVVVAPIAILIQVL